MKLSLALLLAPLALAQSSTSSGAAPSSTSGNSTNGTAYLQSVLQTLTQANLTSLVSVVSSIANTTEGMALLSQLSQGNKTVFAPNNQAFMNVSHNVSSNTTLLTTILSYHITNNTYTSNGTAVFPNHTIARSLLRGGVYSLPGNLSAPVVLARNASDAKSFTIYEAATNVSTTGPAMAANLNVYIIDKVLDLPPTIGDAVQMLLPSLGGVIQQANLLAPLAASRGITVFAPANSAINGSMAALGMLNKTQIQTLLANHVINGTVAYSTGLASGNYTSAAGEPFKFMSNTSGTFVMSAKSTAKIIQSDVIIANGVVHVIDGVLMNNMSDPGAAASAYSSGIAAANATSPAPTGSAGSSSGAAGNIQPSGFTGSMIGAIVGVVAAVMGGAMVLM